MEWMLTDEEIWKAIRNLEAEKDKLGEELWNITTYHKAVAQTQARKLVKWGDELCEGRGYPHAEGIYTKKNCHYCWDELKRQVGISDD